MRLFIIRATDLGRNVCWNAILGQREYLVLQAGFPEGHYACLLAECKQTPAHGQSLGSLPTSCVMIDTRRVDWGNVSGLVGFQKNAKHATPRGIFIRDPNNSPTWHINLNDGRSEDGQWNHSGD